MILSKYAGCAWLLLALVAAPVAAQIAIPAGSTVTLGGATLNVSCADISVAGSLTTGTGQLAGARDVIVAGGGTLNGGSGVVALSRNFTQSGNFVAGTSAVQISDGCAATASTFTGASSFYGFAVTTAAGRSLIFPAGQTQSVAHALTLTGAAGALITIRSSSAGTAGNLALANGATQTIGYVDVADNHATVKPIGLGAAATFHSVKGSNSNGWFLPGTMTANAGTTPQSAAVNTAFAHPLAVTVDDAASNPMSGVSVTFTSPGSGASGVFSNSSTSIVVPTNASGVASTAFTANGTVGGPYTVTAAATGLTTVNFSLTNNGGNAPVLQSAISRKVHGAAGTFDLPLSALVTNPTTEPRQGPAQTIVFTFDRPVNAATATVTEGTAVAGAPTFSGNAVVVGLTGVTNQQYVTISLTGVASPDGSTGGSGAVRVGFLLGDVNQNRVVTVADLAIVNAQLAQTVTAANYLKDVNASGTLTVADKAITNANLTKALPAP